MQELAGLELNNRVMVALDTDDRDRALNLAQQLSGSGCWLKVGLELYAHEGPDILRKLKELGFPIFLDLKLHDIPTTVEKAMRVLTRWGVDMINVHCSGGHEMMARAAAAVREEGAKLGKTPKLIGVTVLTSMGAAQLKEELGVERELTRQVITLAKLAKHSGLDGVVASAQEAKALRQECGEDFLLVTPGIRPSWSQTDDQVRICTPKEAIEFGSSYLVVGRPITKAESPRQALERLWE